MTTTTNYEKQRKKLIERELRALGIEDTSVLRAMMAIPREEFISDDLREFAYRNTPLPIEAGQTISQPSMVAYMTEALELSPRDRVLEIGTGSGYAAAILSQLVAEVFTIERHQELANIAQQRLHRLGYDNVHVRHDDGTLGWPDEAPFDAIIVAASGPEVPPALQQQLAHHGRLVIPVGEDSQSQELVRVIRRKDDQFEYEKLTAVRFVPLIGEAGWQENPPLTSRKPVDRPQRKRLGVSQMIRDTAEPISSIDTVDMQPLLDRIGDASLVLIGEATHGTSEFYRIRAEISKALIEQKNFDFIAVEADWPDAYRIHEFVTDHQRAEPHDWEAFARFPTWMWRNQEVQDFIHWLRDHNAEQRGANQRVGFYGLDLYSMYTSIDRVLQYLDDVDGEAANAARARYGCLTPWEADPANYGRATLRGNYRQCEADVTCVLKDLMSQRMKAITRDGEPLFDAQANARLVANAEKYYRIMYYGSDESWNHRDTHMFETLQSLLRQRGRKAIVWEHNSHLGDAAATQFGQRGQLNVGQLCRQEFGNDCYSIGQGTDHGTVAASSQWEGAMEIKQVRPSISDSYEHLMHLSELEAFFLPLKESPNPQLTSALMSKRLERAIGVIYRPETERLSHYFEASLARQFDEWIWFDETSAVNALTTEQSEQHEPMHPFITVDR